MSDAASYTVVDGIAVITMNNPPVNGLGSVLRPGIMDGIKKAGADPEVKALVIIGSAKAFSGGADIREFNTPKMNVPPSRRRATKRRETAPTVLTAIGVRARPAASSRSAPLPRRAAKSKMGARVKRGCSRLGGTKRLRARRGRMPC